MSHPLESDSLSPSHPSLPRMSWLHTYSSHPSLTKERSQCTAILPDFYPALFPSPSNHFQEPSTTYLPLLTIPLFHRLCIATLSLRTPKTTSSLSPNLYHFTSLSSIQEFLESPSHSRQYWGPFTTPTTSSPWGSGLPWLLPPYPHPACTPLTVLFHPVHNPPKEGSLSLSLGPFLLFLVIFTLPISEFTSTNDPQIFVYSDSIRPKANSPSSISNQAQTHLFNVSAHDITILSTFQASGLRVTLVFYLYPLPLAATSYRLGMSSFSLLPL